MSLGDTRGKLLCGGTVNFSKLGNNQGKTVCSLEERNNFWGDNNFRGG